MRRFGDWLARPFNASILVLLASLILVPAALGLAILMEVLN